MILIIIINIYFLINAKNKIIIFLEFFCCKKIVKININSNYFEIMRS